MTRFVSVLLAGAAVVALATPASAEQELHVLHAGGQWGDAITKCVEEDMAKTMGIKVIPESPGGLAKLRAEVESNLRKVEGLITEINRKWPFKRDTEIKLP